MHRGKPQRARKKPRRERGGGHIWALKEYCILCQKQQSTQEMDYENGSRQDITAF